MKKLILLFALFLNFVTFAQQNLTSVLTEGKTFETAETDQDSYMKFTSTTNADNNMKFGYDGIIQGTKFNGGIYEFSWLSRTGLYFGYGMTSVRLLRNVNQVTNTQINAFLPAAGGTLATIKTTAPSSSTDTGVLGEIRITSDFLYVCIAPNTWNRYATSVWP